MKKLIISLFQALIVSFNLQAYNGSGSNGGGVGGGGGAMTASIFMPMLPLDIADI